jgi:2-phosphosulfolactate phosphatase
LSAWQQARRACWKRKKWGNVYLNVFFTPAEIVSAEAHADDIYIVIDVIRATTSMAVMLERGAARVLAAMDIEMAHAGAALAPARLLCGERNARPIPGFDYGNSPFQFSQLDLSGREMILTTTNGTRAFHACPEASVRLAGSLYNARAVAARALSLAQERGGNIALVCAGELGFFALDDAVCAGYLARELQEQREQRGEAPPQLHEGVLAALAISHAYPPPTLLRYSNAAASVIAAGLQEDADFCMQTSRSESVAMVVGREAQTGLLLLEKAP